MCAANLTFTDSLLLLIQETFDSWTSILDLTKKAALTSTDRPGPFGQMTVMPNILLRGAVYLCNLGCSADIYGAQMQVTENFYSING